MTSIGDRYKQGGITAHLYRWLRLAGGGLRGLSDLFPASGCIVDLGCGAGLLAHLLVEGHPDRRVVAVDHDGARVEALRESTGDLPIEAVCADMATYELPPCAGIALVDVLHYLGGAAQERVIARAVAALEPGGVIVLRDPDADAGVRFALAALHERLATAVGFTQATLGRYRPARAWETLLRAHGLRTEVRPLPLLSPYADRTIVGRRP